MPLKGWIIYEWRHVKCINFFSLGDTLINYFPVHEFYNESHIVHATHSWGRQINWNLIVGLKHFDLSCEKIFPAVIYHQQCISILFADYTTTPGYNLLNMYILYTDTWMK